MLERERLVRYDVIVVGNGLIGAAAARYLAARRDRVAVIGPGEPPTPVDHEGVFSSHYDQGRLVSGFGDDPIWAVIGRLAIDQFESLRRRSGIEFHSAVGRLSAVRLDDGQRAALERRVHEHGDAVELFGVDRSWRHRFPDIDLPNDLDVLFEGGGAGVIDPRAMIRAQNTLARRAGADVVEHEVAAITADSVGVEVLLGDGQRLSADRVLVACGAFTNADGLLPHPVSIRCKTETTVWGALTEATAEAMGELPAITSDVDDPDLDDIYIAPPLKYPDGVHRIKIGANTRHESWPDTISEINGWFRKGGSDLDRPALERQLRCHFPTVDFIEITSHRCVVAYTPTGYPTIDRAPHDTTGRLFVAVGGNGQGAGGSDTLGMLASLTAAGDPWPIDVPRYRRPARRPTGVDSTRAPVQSAVNALAWRSARLTNSSADRWVLSSTTGHA